MPNTATTDMSHEVLIDRLAVLIQQCNDKQNLGDKAVARELENVVSYIKMMESKLLRRDETIRELRRTVMLEMLSLQTRGHSDESRNEIQRKTIHKLRQDELQLVESRKKIVQLEEELKRVNLVNSSLKMSCDVEKTSLRRTVDQLEFKNNELSERLKFMKAETKQLNIVMIGKDAIIEKQYEQLQERDDDTEALRAVLSILETKKAELIATNETMCKKIADLERHNDNKFVKDRLETVKQENVHLRKSLADYKVGFNNLTLKCQNLTEKLDQSTESVDKVKNRRRSSSISVSDAAVKINGESDTSLTRMTGVDRIANTRNKRKSVSRMSVRYKNNADDQLLEEWVNEQSKCDSVSKPSQENYEVISSNDEKATRIQLRRLRTDASQKIESKNFEDKICQVNIGTSAYANVRMGNEEEIVTKALQQRIAELEEIIEGETAKMEDFMLESKKKELRNQISDTSEEPTWLEYKSLTYDDFLAGKAENEKNMLTNDGLRSELEELKASVVDVQAVKTTVECKAIQCQQQQFMIDSGVQTGNVSRSCSTQTQLRTPVSYHQAEEDPFHNYLFKELLEICKHVVKTYKSNCPPNADFSTFETNCKLLGCMNLVMSLNTFRRDVVEEIKCRSEFNTLRSRSLLRCIEVILKAFDRIVNDMNADNENGKEVSTKDLNLDKNTHLVEISCDHKIMTPITYDMSKFKHEYSAYDYDYQGNRVLFSRISTPTMLQSSDHVGGGAAKGSLMRPNIVGHKNTKDMKNCLTHKLDEHAEPNWVISDVDESFLGSFIEKSPQVGHQLQDISSNNEKRSELMTDNDMPSVNVTPIKLFSQRHVPSISKKNYAKGTCKASEEIGEFLSISRPLSPQREKCRPSPRHITLVEKRGNPTCGH